MKRFIKAVAVCLGLCVVSTSVLAANLRIEPTNANGNFHISGSADSGKQVLMQVFVAENDWSKTSIGSLTEADVAYVGQMIANDNGYEFDINVGGLSEDYQVLVYSDGTCIDERSFNFSDPIEFGEKVTELTEDAQQDGDLTSKISVIASKLDTYKKALGLSMDLYNNMTSQEKTTLAKLLYNNGLNSGALKQLADSGSDEDILNAKYAIHKCAIITALNSGKIQNLFDYSSEINMGGSAISSWYNRDIVTDDMQKKITARLSEKGLATIEEFDSLLTESFILEVIAAPDGEGNVKEIIEDFEVFLGVDTKDAVIDDYRDLIGRSFNDKDDLKDAFNPGKNDNKNNFKPVGGGGGTGGGTIGGGSSVKIDRTFAPVQNITPIYSSDAVEQPIQFVDLVDYPWAESQIKELAERKIVSGTDENYFEPGSPITREAFVKIVAGIFDLDTSGSVPFKDVDVNSWAYPYIVAVYNSGIVNGISSTEFGMGLEITRQDMCRIIYNATVKMGIELKKEYPLKEFADNNDIASYAKEAVAVMQTSGIINGKDNNCFEPNSYATRAEAAVMLHRLLPLVDSLN